MGSIGTKKACGTLIVNLENKLLMLKYQYIFIVELKVSPKYSSNTEDHQQLLKNSKAWVFIMSFMRNPQGDCLEA